MGRPESAALELRVAPDPRLGRAVRERVEGFTTACVVPKADAIEFVTAVSEAFANAVEHAASEEPIELSCSLADGGQLQATIVDHGIGLPPDRAVGPMSLPDDWSERGRGLAIMRRCSDLLSVRSTPGHGTTIVIGRSLRPHAAH